MEEATANVPELSVRQDLMLRDQYPDNDGPTRDWDHSVSGYTDDHGTRAVDSVSHTRSTEAVAGSSDISTYEVVPGPVITTSTKSGPALPCYLLKGQQKNKTFCAREDVLRRLDDILVNQATADSAIPSGPNIFAICGFGGIGKTQIAVEFAYSRMNKFDAIFWLHADNSAKLAKDFGDIAQALGLEQIYGDQVISKDLVLDWLSRAAGEHSSEQNLDKTHSPKWLLIFDNADDPTILRDYIPVTGNGSILVTSRDPLAKTQTHFRTTDGIDLDVLSTRDAASLLRTLIGNTIDIRDVELSQIISEKLSGLPLAIAQIAGTIQRRGLSLDEFLVLYENDSNRVDFYQAADGDVTSVTGTQNTIFAVWALEDLGANAACLLDLMAFMDPDQIPESIYTEFNDGSPNQTLHLNISSFLSNPLEYVNARTELSRSSLLRRNIQLKELSLHRLIQDAARARMNDDRKAQVFKSSISLLYSAWPFGTFDHSNARHPLCEQICPHIRPLQIQYQSSTTLQRYVKSNTQFARLLMDAGW
ncbi:P-loop containing nucleoside triphosphate hydrolase protein [Hypoxylon cercidicola]|nr:P-loop containing nucleoside triphosphate hydrolase protein [Hypoxylon cercidicola]